MFVQQPLRVDHPYGPNPSTAIGSGRLREFGNVQFLSVNHGNLFNPYGLANIAARYSLDGSPGDGTYLIDGSNRLMLVADRSGNSAVNGLVLNAAANNSATTPNAAPLQITGDIDIAVLACADDNTPSGQQALLTKWAAAPQRGYFFGVNTNGTTALEWSTNGTALIQVASTAAPTTTDLVTTIWRRVTLDVDNGAGGYTVTFYTSTDGANWTQLGNTVVGGSTTTIHASTEALGVGAFAGGSTVFAGKIFRAWVKSGINGTVVFDANFTAVAKLAASFTESSANAATVTINTSGDTGARICGARDLYQGTQAKQPTFSVSGGYNIATFDGSNDYLKSAPFSLNQAATRHLVISQPTWTNTDQICDGNSTTTFGIVQSGVSPAIVMTAGSAVASNTDFTTATRKVVSAVFNGASSRLRVNQGTATTGNAGAGNPGGVTVGARSDGSLPANITWSEDLIRSIAEEVSEELRINAFEASKWGAG